MKPLKKILFLASADQDDSHALERAASLAESNQASLTIAMVISGPPGYRLLLKTHSIFKSLMDKELERYSTLLGRVDKLNFA